MSEIPRKYLERAPVPEVVETRQSFLNRLRHSVDAGIESCIEKIKVGDAEGFFVELGKRVREFGVDIADIHVGVQEVCGLHREVSLELPRRSNFWEGRMNLVREQAPSFRVAVFGALLTGYGPEIPKSEPQRLDTSDSSEDIVPLGESPLENELPSSQLANIIASDCGPFNPEHAPDECGVQQWKGYSETNPAAVAWMAILNTGTESCRVKITRLELSYGTRDVDGVVEMRELLTSGINAAQLLADGTEDGEYWGKYQGMFSSSESTFELDPGMHAYVHPFGHMVEVPDGAGELTVTFSAEIESGCSVGAGLDTYQEYAEPHTNPPYTQDGRPTDFIQEAYKAPWVNKTIDARAPVSFSIERLPRGERTGWKKGDAVPE